MDEPTRAVLAHVDARGLIELASDLIRIPSFKTEETPVALFLEKLFRARGYDVDLQEIEPGRFQTIATLRGTGGGASLMLNGHTDINALTRRWKRDPWTPSLEGDRLYGHGVQKMTHIVRALEDVEFRHMPRPDLPAFPRLNVGSILGGRGQDYVLVEPPYVPDLCTILVDVHFVPGQTVDGIVADIRRALDPVAARDSDLRYEIEIPPPAGFKGRRRLGMDPFDMPTDAPIVQAVARSYRTVTCREPKAIGTLLPHSYSADDTCHLWKAGIPCLLYGPATIRGNADEDDACVLVSEMERVTRVLAATAVDVCQRKPAELAVQTINRG